MLQDAAPPAMGHRSDRRAVLDDQRRAHHDDSRDKRRTTGAAAQHADGGAVEAAPAPQVMCLTLHPTLLDQALPAWFQKQAWHNEMGISRYFELPPV